MVRRLTGGLLASALALSATVTFTASPAEAYIPSSRVISGRLAKNNGKGAYVIEQEVQFRSLAEPLTLRERWIVENGEAMRLYVSTPKAATTPAKFDILYRDGKRTAPDLQGSLKTTHVGPEFIESFQHFRSGRGFLESLVRARILPGSFLRDRPRITSEKNIKYQPEALVRLGRTGGVVTWVFGEPTPVDSAKLSPEAWIEQDDFLLRKLRFPSQAEVTAENFEIAPGNLRFPRERTVAWGENTVAIRLISLKPLATASANQLLAPSALTPADAKGARLPELPQVKEFYSRFR